MDDVAQQAYQSRDLAALVGLMTNEQQFFFKYAVVRQAVYYAELRLPPEDEDDGERGCISFAQAWLHDPTPEKAHSAGVMAYFDSMDGGVRYSDYPPLFLEPAWAASAAEGTTAMLLAADSARRVAREEQEPDALAWQIEAAWAILKGIEAPQL